MPNNMLDDIISRMETPAGTVKVAAATPVAPSGAAEMDTLQQALTKTATAVPAVQAPDANPVDALFEKAAQLAGADQEANRAEAAMIGAAMADGFLAKMASAEQEVKVAQANVPPVPAYQYTPQDAAPFMPRAVDPEIEKVAGEFAHLDTASMQKLAADAGYQSVMEKAAEDYQMGHDSALQEVGNVAYGEFLKGAAETEELLRRMASQPQ